MLVKNIPRDQLAPYCAKAQRWELLTETDNPSVYRPLWLIGKGFIAKADYDPLTNGQQVYDLIVGFDVDVETNSPITKDMWGFTKERVAFICDENGMATVWQEGADPAEAVMRAVIASYYGEEIREEE